METTMRKETEKAMQDIDTAVREGEAVLKAETGNSGGDGRDLRARLQIAIDKATATCERLQEKTVAAAKAADEVIREHPYQTAGLAFGVGLLIGVLAMRYRSRD